MAAGAIARILLGLAVKGAKKTSKKAVKKPKGAKAAIFINLPGGPSHMDTFDPKPDAPSEYPGEFNAIGGVFNTILVNSTQSWRR